jgi:hypothetical protein
VLGAHRPVGRHLARAVHAGDAGGDPGREQILDGEQLAETLEIVDLG